MNKFRPGHTRFFFLLVLIASLGVYTAQAQNKMQSTSSYKTLLGKYEDSLIALGKQIVSAPIEDDRQRASYHFIPTLVRALKIPGSYNYPFDSLKTVRVTVSPDNTFRIFTWFVNQNDVSYRFYGAIQMNTRILTLYPLIDYTDHIQKPEDTVTGRRKWYGAEYYAILPRSTGGVYLLLGWKGISDKMTERVIEALSFKNDEPFFGASVFAYHNTGPKRILFKYTRQASMMLKYLADKNEILFDHLAPPAAGQEGKFEVYGPDLSYDALVQSGGKWVLKEGVEISNEKSEKDAQFISPSKKPILK